MVSRQHHIGKRLNWIIAAACAAAIIGIWLITLQRISSERSQALDAVMNSNSNLAIAFEQQVIRTLRAAEQVATFVRHQYVRQGADINLREWVECGIIRETMFTVISVVNESGNIVSSSLADKSVNYADREFFLAQRDAVHDDLFISVPLVGRVSGETRIPMSLRISHSDGSFAGVVVMAVDPGSFTDFYRYADLGGRGLLELAGLDGVVRGRRVGQVNDFGQDATRLAWFQKQTQAVHGSFVDAGSAPDGVARIVSYRSLTDYPLMVTVGTAYADDLAPALQRRRYYLAAAGLASGILPVFAGLLILLMRRQRTAAEALQSSEALYRATFHQAATGILHIAPDGRILGMNEKCCHMLGYSADELRARTIFELSTPDARETLRQFLQHCLSTSPSAFSAEIEKPYQRKDGSILWVCEALGVVRDKQGQPDFLVAVTQDITARKELEERLSHDASHDALTGLPNRKLFQERLLQVMESSRRHGRLAAVLYLDLDEFKEVNDRYGHTVGDALLQQVAQRLRSCMRVEDTVARFGGDEFGIVLDTITGPGDCEIVAAKLISVLSQPYEIDDITIMISASVGAAVFPSDGHDALSLVAHADAAMYEVKRRGKGLTSARL